MDNSKAPVFGSYSRKGNREFNCDYVAEHRIPSTGVVAVALVDGMGNSFEVASDAFLCAHAAARTGANKGAIPGIMAATDMLGVDPANEFHSPDAVLALAISRPGAPTVIGYIGDPAAFAYDPGADRQLARLTEDHTLGQRLRLQGVPEQAATKHDSQITTSVGRATVGTITVVTANAPTTLLASDGVHRALTEDQIREILARYLPDAQAAAAALTSAAQDAGSVDDATAALLTLH